MLDRDIMEVTHRLIPGTRGGYFLNGKQFTATATNLQQLYVLKFLFATLFYSLIYSQ